MKTSTILAVLLVALLAECTGNDYGFLFQDAGTCADAASLPDASCDP